MLQALRDDVIVKLVCEDYVGNIIIPKDSHVHRWYSGRVYGLVISVGSKYKYDLKPGDKIDYQRNEGIRFFYEGDTYYQLRGKKDWIHAILTD